MEARTDDDQRARIDMTVEISDLKHLEKVIKSLRGVEGVLGVERAGRARTGGVGWAVDGGRQMSDLPSLAPPTRTIAIASISTRASLRQPRDLHGRARRIRLREVRAVDLVHRREVVHVGEEDRGAHDVGERQAAGFEHGAEVVEARGASARRCRPRSSAGGRIERHLPGDEQQLAGADRLRVRADRLGRRSGLGRSPASLSTTRPSYDLAASAGSGCRRGCA